MRTIILMVKYQHVCTYISYTAKQRRLIKVNALIRSLVRVFQEHSGRLQLEQRYTSQAGGTE
uniref:Uncharacterized protein n=1 Tax=Prolemur simus TaxID=1328070 RepID=A0A8C9A9J5_PROSS